MNWIEVKKPDGTLSSNIAAAAYDESSLTMRIRFRGGSSYEYSGVPREIFEGLLTAPSPGKFFNQVIRRSFSFKKCEGDDEPNDS